MVLDSKAIRALHLINKMLECKEPMPSLEVAQVVTKPWINENLAKLQAKIAINIVLVFETSTFTILTFVEDILRISSNRQDISFYV